MNLDIIFIRYYGRFKHARRRARDPARDLSPTLVRRSAEALQGKRARCLSEPLLFPQVILSPQELRRVMKRLDVEKWLMEGC